MAENQDITADMNLHEEHVHAGVGGDHESQRDTVRHRPLTEKGLQYKMDLKLKKCHQACRTLQSKGDCIYGMMREHADHREIQLTFSHWLTLYENMLDIHDELSELLTSEEMTKYMVWFSPINNESLRFKAKLEEYLTETRSEDVKSRISSKSDRSRLSRRSSNISESRLKEEQLQAELKVRASAFKAKRELEEAKLQLRLKEEEFDIQEQLAISHAKTEVLSAHGSQPSNTSIGFMDNPQDLGEEFFSRTDTMPTRVETTLRDHISGRLRVLESRDVVKTKDSPHRNSADIQDNSNLHISQNNDSPQRELPDEMERIPNITRSICDEIRQESSPMENKQTSGIDSLIEHLRVSRLPIPEPGHFSGDPLQYHHWKCAFKTLIRGIPDQERLYYLKNYLSGDARACVEGFFMLDSVDSFKEAFELLDERFGDPFVVANAFRDKLDKWPKILSRDCKGLVKFSDFLKQCRAATSKVESLHILNDERENKKILAKLPEWLITRWGRIVVDFKEQNHRFPQFTKFVDFIAREAKIAADPITSLQAIKECSDPGQRISRLKGQKSEVRALSTDAKIEPVRKSTKVCVVCSLAHDLNDCTKFLEKSLEQRVELVKAKGLCFGCLHQGHISKKCKRRQVCKTCNKKHPTSLHIVTDENKTSFAQRNVVSKGDKCSMILPVWISHKDNPKCEKLIYALLDTQSDTTFVLENTAKSLNQSGFPVKLLLSTMSTTRQPIDSAVISGLRVRGYDSEKTIYLPPAYTREIMPANHEHIPSPEKTSNWPHLRELSDKLTPPMNCEVGLLIGYDCPEALVPREIVAPTGDGPFGQRTDLGWGIVGIVKPFSVTDRDFDPIGMSHNLVSYEVSKHDSCEVDHHSVLVLRNKVEVLTPLQMMELDFTDNRPYDMAASREDQKFLEIMGQGIKQRNDGHYEMPLPFRDDFSMKMPNNRALADHRVKKLRNKLKVNPQYRSDYFTFMNRIIDNDHAEKVPQDELDLNESSVWYLPHHGVYNPKKPGKLRVVFDASAQYHGVSLNNNLLQGPDLTNSLIGVLLRFRQERIALMCDIEQMFHQFQVNPAHRDYFRFLWWEGDLNSEPIDFRMKVHLFGAKSSPACANYGLKQIAKDHGQRFSDEASKFIVHNFYVDDGLVSVPTVEDAINLLKDTQSLCSQGSLRLHKFASNSQEVMDSVPESDKTNSKRDLPETQPIERALGVQWCIESDSFQFRIIIPDKPLTRRGVLSIVSSIYDPLGFIAPYVLEGKRILQEMCRTTIGWDTALPDCLRPRWIKWLEGLPNLEKIQLSRSYIPNGFGKVVSMELHHFSDASTLGYGQCSYLRLQDDNGRIHCSLLTGKSRVAPLKLITIPRLELTAALLSIKTSIKLSDELDYSDVSQIFWTDSKVVLGYINNESRRFHVFVANRVEQIRMVSNPSQWRYIRSQDNPADDASRGLIPENHVNDNRWFKGPEFLWKDIVEDTITDQCEIESDDPEVKNVIVHATHIKTETLLTRFEIFSSWFTIRRAVAVWLRVKTILKGRMYRRSMTTASAKQSKHKFEPSSVEVLQEAQSLIIGWVQAESFPEEIKILQALKHKEIQNRSRECKEHIKGTSSLYRLDPFLDSCNILRVGGRLSQSGYSSSVKNPIILPRKHHITTLIIRSCHENVSHQGRGLTTNAIRSQGFWIIGCSSAVSFEISKCVTCRRSRASVQEQKMSDLPDDRSAPAPPFTYCAVDYFGPFQVKEGRRQVKRYGALFTCLSSRAIHIEVADSLSTDSFLNALRRFISIRGPIRQLRSDRGTNFVGAKRELEESLAEMDHESIGHFLLGKQCDYIRFKMNVPSASHQGGVWERQIRTVRSVLNCMTELIASQLDDDSLRTLLCEVTAIVNGRPLTTDNLFDPMSLEPLTPNHLLTGKSEIVLPPPGSFDSEDLYLRKRWRRVQYLTNQFWIRWKREFLQSLQTRNKWNRPHRDLQIGDIVIIKDDNLPRGLWMLGRIDSTYPDPDGHVRKVKIAVGDRSLDNNGKRLKPTSYFERPVQKLVLLLESSDG